VRGLQRVEDRQERRDLLDVGHLRERDDGAATAQRTEEEVPRADAAVAGRRLQGIAADPDLRGCDTGDTVTEELVRRVIEEEVAGIGDLDRLDDARRLFEQVALAEDFPDFLTLPAYELVN